MKKIVFPLAMVLFLTSFLGLATATVFQYDSGQYQTPEGWGAVATQEPIDLDHSSYYFWGLDDLNQDTNLTQINIVFYGIHDWYYGEDDSLTLYIKDGREVDGQEVDGWEKIGWDGQSTSAPDWTGMGFTQINGSWSDPKGGPYGLPQGETTAYYDVVFTINDSTILSWLLDGDGFTIGIDPDCHYWGDKITVEAPVPEPATILLLGLGLVSIALFGRKKYTA